jgi:hypothetical protein
VCVRPASATQVTSLLVSGPYVAASDAVLTHIGEFPFRKPAAVRRGQRFEVAWVQDGRPFVRFLENES